jgi:hypothetical protein
MKSMIVVWLVAVVVAGAATPTSPTDAEISAAVETFLFVNNYVPAYTLDVTTAEGVVAVSGTVEKLLAKKRTVQLAHSLKDMRPDVEIKADVVNNLAAKQADGADACTTVGIWNVHNQFKVWPATVPSDVELAQRIESACRPSRGQRPESRCHESSQSPTTRGEHSEKPYSSSKRIGGCA